MRSVPYGLSINITSICDSLSKAEKEGVLIIFRPPWTCYTTRDDKRGNTQLQNPLKLFETANLEVWKCQCKTSDSLVHSYNISDDAFSSRTPNKRYCRDLLKHIGCFMPSYSFLCLFICVVLSRANDRQAQNCLRKDRRRSGPIKISHLIQTVLQIDRTWHRRWQQSLTSDPSIYLSVWGIEFPGIGIAQDARQACWKFDWAMLCLVYNSISFKKHVEKPLESGESMIGKCEFSLHKRISSACETIGFIYRSNFGFFKTNIMTKACQREGKLLIR
jgi:hypothetical protein